MGQYIYSMHGHNFWEFKRRSLKDLYNVWHICFSVWILYVSVFGTFSVENGHFWARWRSGEWRRISRMREKYPEFGIWHSTHTCLQQTFSIFFSHWIAIDFVSEKFKSDIEKYTQSRNSGQIQWTKYIMRSIFFWFILSSFHIGFWSKVNQN